MFAVALQELALQDVAGACFACVERSTSIYFRCVPKQLRVLLLPQFCQEKKQGPLTEQSIRNMDKANLLTRITRSVTFVGRVRMTDHVTKEMRYKPLLFDVMFRRMMEGGCFLEASPDGRSGAI